MGHLLNGMINVKFCKLLNFFCLFSEIQGMSCIKIKKNLPRNCIKISL